MFEKLLQSSGLSLQRLKTFHGIVTAGGIRAAAGPDANRQSQFSRQLTELERYFGAQLIERRRGMLRLTPAGKDLFRIINHVFRSLEEFHERCANQPVRIVIGAGEGLIQWLLLARLSALTASQPRLSLTLENRRTEHILSGVRDGTLDFGVVSRFKPERGFSARSLGELQYGLFVSKQIWARVRRRSRSCTLADVPLALLEGSPGIRQAVEVEARRLGVSLDIRLRCSSYPQLAEAVQHMNMAAILPTLARVALSRETIEIVRLPFLDALTRQVSLLWNNTFAELRPTVRTLSRLLPPLLHLAKDSQAVTGGTAI